MRKRFDLWTLLRRDGRLLWHALRHPDAPRWLRPAVAGAGSAYPPIDLIPDVVGLGLGIDLMLIPLAVHMILKRRRHGHSPSGRSTGWRDDKTAIASRQGAAASYAKLSAALAPP